MEAASYLGFAGRREQDRRGALRPRRRPPATPDRRRRLCRHPEPGGQHRADVRLRHLLVRARARQRSLRERLPGIQPVDRDWPGHRLGHAPDRRRPRGGRAPLSGMARPVARRCGPARVRLARADLARRSRASNARRRDARLLERDPARHGALRRRAVESQRRSVLRVLRALLPNVGPRAPRRRDRAPTAACRSHPAPARSRHDRGRCRDDRLGHVRRRSRRPVSGATSGPPSRASSPPSARGPRSRTSSQPARAS